MTEAEIARRALPLLDLTNLDDACDSAAVDALCARARGPHGEVAAVCVWPQFVAQARAALAGSGVKVATVVAFPSGRAADAVRRSEIEAALAHGADEIDMVIDWRALLAGETEAVSQSIRLARAACAGAGLKVILETGELKAPDPIALASKIALAEGADFIKTSTGKVPVNATLEAARLMLSALREGGGLKGFKASGGVRTVVQAREYMALADEILGPDWLTTKVFRFGASGVLDALEQAISADA